MHTYSHGGQFKKQLDVFFLFGQFLSLYVSSFSLLDQRRFCAVARPATHFTFLLKMQASSRQIDIYIFLVSSGMSS